MSYGSTPPVAILTIKIHGKVELWRLNNSDIDLSLKHKYVLFQCCGSHISFGVIMCHGVAESTENEDIVLHNYEMETTPISKPYLCVSEACLIHIDKQHDIIGVSDSVRFFHVKLKTLNGDKLVDQKKVVGGKEGESITYYSWIEEGTSHHDKRRHRKKSCSLQYDRMFKFRMFLISVINLRIPVKASKTSNGKQCINGEVAGKATKEELSLYFCVKTKKLLQFYLCGSNTCNGRAKIIQYSSTHQGMIYNGEMAKASFIEDFEKVLHELSADCFPQCDSIGENLFHGGELGLVIAPPRDSSVETDQNVLDNDLSVDHSVETDQNVLDNDLSVDHSVETEKNVLDSDLSRDHSVDHSVQTYKNVLHNDLSGNSSFETDKNVLHNDSSRGSSFETDKIVLLKDVSEDSYVEVDKNVLIKDLSVDISVEVDKNGLPGDLPGNSPVDVIHHNLSAHNSVKICGNDLHSDLLVDSSKSLKITKNCHDVTFEIDSMKTSKPMYNSKSIEDNTHPIKATNNIDPIRSYMDILSLLGIYPRCSHSLPMFRQVITLYPFRRLQGDLHQLMRYEVFRLCSFSYARFPANFDVWVTHLAQAGFYCENENGRIVCFHCGRAFQGSVGSSIEDGHHPECDYHEHSRPLHVWTEGLNQEVLAIYYNRYGSLRPYNFEASSQQSLPDHTDRAHETEQGSAVTEPPAQRYSEQATGDTAAERQPGTAAEVNREDSSIVEAALPEYHSMALSGDSSEANRDHRFGDQAQSLPGNLNEVSGAVVSEESQDLPGSYQVLTSAATNPMPFYSTATRGSQSQSDDGNEHGAVGGAGVTLDLSKASYPLFSSAEARRQTFTAWSPTHSHRPEDLAAAGFFYAGYADCVRCFCCGLGLKYWRPADIPAYQHARYRPHCVYNRLYKGQDYVDRVQQDLRTEQGVTNQNVEAIAPAQDEVAPALGEVAPATVARPDRVQDEEAPVTRAPLVPEAPRIPDLMESEVAQTAMRAGWQRNQVQQAVDHIVQEFNVHSLEIGLLLDVLSNLNVDEPERNLPSGGSGSSADSGINDSARRPSSADANDVNAVLIGAVPNVQRGIDVADAIHDEEAAAQPQPRAVLIQQPAVPPIEFNELFRSVEREHALLSERTTCRVCRRQPVSCIYLPCGHVIACQDCADVATHCILCTKQIIGTANIFLA